MQTIYNMLCISLGKPPVKFDFEVKTPNGFVRDLGITPQSFFKKSTSTWIFPSTSAPHQCADVR